MNEEIKKTSGGSIWNVKIETDSKRKGFYSFIIFSFVVFLTLCPAFASSINQKLVSAVEKGNLADVKQLISDGADVNARDKYGNTPLIYAAAYGYLDLVKYLVSKGADVNVKGNRGNTPLIFAAGNGYLEIVKFLVSKGADVNVRGWMGQTPLYYAVKGGYFEIVKYLISKGADVDAAALLCAVDEGYLPIVKYLVSEGANVNARDHIGETPLHYVTEKRHVSKNDLEIVEYLVSHGADVNAKNDFGITPLHYAVKNGHLDIVKYLISKGADVNAKAKSGSGKKTPLHYAAAKGYLEIVKLLVNNGADIDAKDGFGQTPLFYAAKNQHLEIIKYLISKGADIDIKDELGNTPVSYARGETRKFLLQFKDIFSMIKSKNPLVLKYLILKGIDVDPNIKDANGNTPLLLVLKESRNVSSRGLLRMYLELERLLLDSGADPNMNDSKGFYPLDLALKNEYEKGKNQDIYRRMVDVLMEKKAKMNSFSIPFFFFHKGINIYDLPTVIALGKSYPQYKSFLIQQTQNLLSFLIRLLKQPEINYTRLGDNVSVKKDFILPITTTAYFVVLGERQINNFEQITGSSKWYDYGYFLSFDKRKYPSFDHPFPAGGDLKNSLIFEERLMPAGKYVLIVKTDNSHSFDSKGKRKWYSYPPDLISPQNWGFRAVFPEIASDSVVVLRKIIKQYPKAPFIKDAKKAYVLASKRIKEERNAKRLYLRIKRRGSKQILSFVKRHPNNLYTPALEAIAAVYRASEFSKQLAVSNVVLTKGRLLPPSKDLEDKLAGLFGLPPKNYGNDEIVVRGAKVEIRGKKIYVTGVVENKSSKTLNANVVGIFQFKTVKQNRVFIFGDTSSRTSVGWGIFKIPSLKPHEKRAFVFTTVSGKGGGISFGWVGSSISRTFLQKYTVWAYVPVNFSISPEERKREESLLKDVGLWNVDLSKVNTARLANIVTSMVKDNEFDASTSSSPDYLIREERNARIEIVRLGGGYQIDVVPKKVCSSGNFYVRTSEGQKNSDPYKLGDVWVSKFPVEVIVDYVGGCGVLSDSKKHVHVKVEFKKQGAYKVYVYPQ